MNISIAHPQPRGRRKRPPVIHSDAIPDGPTPLQVAIAEANAKAIKRKPGRPRRVKALDPSALLEDDLDRTINEDNFAGHIVAYAHLCGGWLIDCKRQGQDAMHIPTGVARDHWREIGDGMPDLLLIHETRSLLVIWELKKDRKPSPLREKQVRWGSGLMPIAAMCPNLVYKVITPADWAYVKAILRGH